MAEQLRYMSNWIDRGLLKAQDEKDFDMVTLNQAIENGYGKAGKIIIDMS